MEPYYQIYVCFNDEGETEVRYESIVDAIESMKQLIGRSAVYSAILAHYSDEYPAGYDVICSIRNKSSLRGRKP